MRSSTTLADIALECGVSISTVSRALSDHPSISEATKRAIRLVAETRGFQPRISARTIQSIESKLIGCIVPSISHPFFASLIEKLEAEAARLGFQLLLANSGRSPAMEKTIVNSLVARQVDGVFFAPSSVDSSAIQFCGKKLNMVLVTHRSADWPSIGTSHEDGGALIAEHFVELGLSSCLLIGDKSDEKFKGFLSYLEMRRISGFKVAWLEVNNLVNSQLSSSIFARIKANYDQSSIRQFDCVFGFNDLAAIGAVHAFQDLGCHIPSEVAVCGFDNTPLAEETHPPLTTVAQPLNQIVQSAFGLLHRLLANEVLAPDERMISLKPHLIVRASSFPRP